MINISVYEIFAQRAPHVEEPGYRRWVVMTPAHLSEENFLERVSSKLGNYVIEFIHKVGRNGACDYGNVIRNHLERNPTQSVYFASWEDYIKPHSIEIYKALIKLYSTQDVPVESKPKRVLELQQ